MLQRLCFIKVRGRAGFLLKEAAKEPSLVNGSRGDGDNIVSIP